LQQQDGKVGSEQRKSPRKKVLLTSKIVYGEGAHVLDCTIRDISATGARITLRSRSSIPANVYLIDMANRIAHESAVVSEREGGYGLKFLKTYPLAQVNKPELCYLKRIWIQYAQ
jgi:hypothetical protein